MKKTISFLILIFIINLIGLYNQWYLIYPWFDQVLHFSGGFLMAILLSIYLKNHLLENAKLKNILIVLGAVSFIGITWEFAEYLASQILVESIYRNFGIRTYFIGDLNDTINDLLMDILGAGLFLFVLHFFRNRKTHKIQTNP
ncbi:MAG: hypothetical protein A2915_04080 [Candidatus Yanofskybacteria bacterium RIFCSPLOWO2_01_FULL_41_34]|uniref:VanZ-like domain-containing protein n=1 Tax=Candidatus Yanofskybacteria bacterium RIFCSPHIGHO2_01_FULL_41_26 TaxID=1802661 RepID=A0A1F8EDU9_9BACT|nr:MAG: hypothetical protein A2649_03180 [Candidatus Yanofskybacteria bacterium RIFCSPHIGHO2_01_FULL_41_26]OGN21588.1 MAG: hypothetical protein A2915_04080 [Candidatus Yanofskybacteria bacterium RIFCSPLOWO2_01_FULL_41_34]